MNSTEVKILIIGETGYGVYGNSVVSLKFFCKSETVSKITFMLKMIKKKQNRHDIMPMIIYMGKKDRL